MVGRVRQLPLKEARRVDYTMSVTDVSSRNSLERLRPFTDSDGQRESSERLLDAMRQLSRADDNTSRRDILSPPWIAYPVTIVEMQESPRQVTPLPRHVTPILKLSADRGGKRICGETLVF